MGDNANENELDNILDAFVTDFESDNDWEDDDELEVSDETETPEVEDDEEADTEDETDEPEGDEDETEESEEDADEETDEVEPDAETPTEEEAAPVLAQEVTVKVMGEEKVVPVSELVKDYELRSASHRRMQEAAEKEKALEEKTSFADTFNSYFAPTNEDGTPVTGEAAAEKRSELFSHLIEQVDDPMPVIQAQIVRLAAIGKLPKIWADALGVDDSKALGYAREYQQETVRKQQEAARAAEVAATQQTQVSEQTVTQLRAAIADIVADADLVDADPAEQEAYVRKVFAFGDANGITDPARAHLRFQRHQAETARKQSELTKKAVRKVSGNKAAAAGLSSGKAKSAAGAADVEFESESDRAMAAVEKFMRF